MTDLPDRIWCDFDEETMDRGVFSDEHFAGDVEYLRADTLPTVVELAEIVWQTYGSYPENLTHEELMAYPFDVATAILNRIKGGE